jgi:hypothetical protein
VRIGSRCIRPWTRSSSCCWSTLSKSRTSPAARPTPGTRSGCASCCSAGCCEPASCRRSRSESCATSPDIASRSSKSERAKPTGCTRCSRTPALTEALTGNFREHHTLIVSHILAHLDYLDAAIGEISTEVERRSVPLAAVVGLFDLRERAAEHRPRRPDRDDSDSGRTERHQDRRGAHAATRPRARRWPDDLRQLATSQPSRPSPKPCAVCSPDPHRHPRESPRSRGPSVSRRPAPTGYASVQAAATQVTGHQALPSAP